MILQRSRARWRELPAPGAVLSALVVFLNAFAQARAGNRIVVVSRGVVFDSALDDLGAFVGGLSHAEDAPLSADLGLVLCLAHARRCRARVLVVSFAADRRVMRCVFGAQKLGTRVDALCFDGNDVVRQAAVLTGGVYWRGEPLPVFFLRVLGSRCDSPPIAFATHCTCHGLVILLGLVCPVCLAVYCRVAPLCKRCRIRLDFK